MKTDYDPVNCQIGDTRIACYYKKCGLCEMLLSGGDYCIIGLGGRYQQKRYFKISPEKRIGNGDGGDIIYNDDTKRTGNIFVIQEHDAGHLHWDLRLEMEGVSKSWVFPKEPPQVDGIRRLAIQIEDHPIDYATFEETVPECNYGDGTIKVWDKGSFRFEGKDENHIVFELNGRKMKGKFVMVKTKYKGKGQWLFFKRKEGLLTF